MLYYFMDFDVTHLPVHVCRQSVAERFCFVRGRWWPTTYTYVYKQVEYHHTSCCSSFHLHNSPSAPICSQDAPNCSSHGCLNVCRMARILSLITFWMLLLNSSLGGMLSKTYPKKATFSSPVSVATLLMLLLSTFICEKQRSLLSTTNKHH